MDAARPRRTRVGKRNQMTIPAAMLRRLGVAPGESVEVVEDGDAITLRKTEDPFEHISGLLYRPGIPMLTIDEMNELLQEGREERAEELIRRLHEPTNGGSLH